MYIYLRCDISVIFNLEIIVLKFIVCCTENSVIDCKLKIYYSNLKTVNNQTESRNLYKNLNPELNYRNKALRIDHHSTVYLSNN